MRKTIGFALVLTVAATAVARAEVRSASLRGSPASMLEQNGVAKTLGLSFHRTEADIMESVAQGELVPLQANDNYAVADFVSLPYLHPAALLFVERTAAQYRVACGQRLVVTSAVRPSTRQPGNAHALSVHPVGMAVDLRVSDRAACRSWLEGTLMSLEQEGVLNGIREFRPPHYHVAIYPEQYLAYAGPLVEAERVATLAAESASAAAVRAADAERTATGAADAASTASTSGARAPLLATLALLLAIPFGRRVLSDRRSAVRADNPGRRSADRD